MKIKVGSIPACAILLIAATGAGAGTAFAQAQETCLTAPTGRAPPGSRWYYHTDPSTQNKCWSLKPAAGQVGHQAAQPAPAQEQPARTTAAATAVAPAAAEPHSTTPNSSPWTMPGEQADQPDTATIAWPAPPPVPASTNPDTPDNVAPVSPDQSAPQAPPPAPQAPTAETAQPTSSSPPAPANPVENSAATQSAAPLVAEPITPVTSVHSRLPLAALLAGLVGLLVIGMLLRRAVIMTLGRRRGVMGRPSGIKVGRQEPRLSAAATQPAVLRHSPSLVPSQAETEHRVGEIEEALRHFAQRLRGRRSAPLGTFPNITRTGARARS
jgi:hypothetical protein